MPFADIIVQVLYAASAAHDLHIDVCVIACAKEQAVWHHPAVVQLLPPHRHLATIIAPAYATAAPEVWIISNMDQQQKDRSSTRTADSTYI